ncbi:TrmB family transcriptional regulator [Candidatus Bathyarchaeota archaeon]|nr:MAG: TrmB family transcriptional regulator [Candidatus Bathyarchaeota archaeon]
MTEPVSEKARKTLREIGLTEYETRAYMYLLRTGATTASRISGNANVPYSKIYEVLNSLERKGWIETRSGRPRRYYPKSPIEALDATRLRIENKMKDWRNSVVEELQPLYEKREIREKPDVWILRGEYDAVAKIKDLVSNAKNHLMIALPAFTEPFMFSLLPLFKSLLDTNVKVSIMVPKDRNENMKVLENIGEVRLKDNMFGGGLIADGREAILILGEKKTSLTIWSDHLGLVKFAKDYFQHLWDSAEKAQQ